MNKIDWLKATFEAVISAGVIVGAYTAMHLLFVIFSEPLA